MIYGVILFVIVLVIYIMIHISNENGELEEKVKSHIRSRKYVKKGLQTQDRIAIDDNYRDRVRSLYDKNE